MRNHIKLLLYNLLIILCIVLILLFPAFISRSVLSSLSLCYRVLIPALFPFLAISGIWLDLTAALSAHPSRSALWISWICGYPIGTKTVCDFFAGGVVSKENATALLYCTANASPSFLLFAVSFKIFGGLQVGFCMIGAQILVSLLLYLFFYKKEAKKADMAPAVFSFFPSLCQSVQNAAGTMVQICAYTVFFGLLSDALALLPLPQKLKILLQGATEMVHGLQLLTDTKNIFLVSVLVGFSGLCIWMQIFSFAIKASLPVFPIAMGKLLYTVLLPPTTVLLFYSGRFFQKIYDVFDKRFLFLPILLIALTLVAKQGIIKKNTIQRKYK